MKLLALDTSTEYLSLALLCDGQVLARDWLAQQRHAELTLPEIRRLVAEAGIALGQLDGLALSIGPGGFTGLRIGCGIAQGLAFGLDIPTVGINTLAALAAEQTGPRVLAALDARMGEFYLAALERDGDDWKEVVATTVCGPDALPELPGGSWHGVGSGFKVAGDALRQRYGSQLAAADAEAFPHARGVLRLAQREFAAGRAVAADRLELLYIRDKVALKTSERPPKPI
ncbi:tRNA (adenosine(37)-N6)-threonylcarbamoyltransferase complex dimerization subunit type 1 TsaB [Chitinimonas koreensis]|uniref:tRNA (adenosine(37)-N6)-threonylcarbamoyltransferase complex dimerization subunit type 1 TsaB n=1 Tax=Chitinimonas koreensis TaxID=356302 RepID=UPI00040F3DA5|nr:tRNA (adenosine(37)-N6)-threonylcarbamoyltransferase complex dimerization subunit type 1 TsaB [Chitinimonas koreensis]QNM98183.1 tRNA (adenosine(37)-N6)-threonylcarbamoyltransferase complex dimerization subunit type 1 TsaB [Chitinimonas koreensis]